jgi:microtubule-associated protein-like 6
MNSDPRVCMRSISPGDDKTLRFYIVHHRRVIATVPLGTMARTVTYSPDGAILAVGFGGPVGKGKEKGGGVLRLYSADPYAKNGVVKLAEVTDAKEWISDVKFSADGRTLAVGAHDCKIYIYSVDSNGTGTAASLKLRSTFAKHSSVVNHLDLSADGRFMQSNCR